MIKQEQSAVTPYPIGIDSSPVPQREDPCPRLGLRVDLRTTSPGVLEIEALPDHRLKIHAGAPVRGRCRHHRFLYTRGDVDIFPAGMADVWEEHEANTSLVLQLSPSLLHRAAEDMGLDPDRAGLEPRCQFRDPQIEHIAWALDAEHGAGYPNGLLYTESLGLALAVHLLGRYPASHRLPRGLSKPQLRRMTTYIEDHLDQNLSLARLAGVAGVSASRMKLNAFLTGREQPQGRFGHAGRFHELTRMADGWPRSASCACCPTRRGVLRPR